MTAAAARIESAEYELSAAVEREDYAEAAVLQEKVAEIRSGLGRMQEIERKESARAQAAWCQRIEETLKDVLLEVRNLSDRLARLESECVIGVEVVRSGGEREPARASLSDVRR